MKSLYFIREVGGKTMMGRSIYGVAVIDGALYSRLCGIDYSHMLLQMQMNDHVIRMGDMEEWTRMLKQLAIITLLLLSECLLSQIQRSDMIKYIDTANCYNGMKKLVALYHSTVFFCASILLSQQQTYHVPFQELAVV